ncbi:MAG: hypothetical protein KDC92_06960 [Bacteroidetes bacterium]|nr:hypothetical protein [Bacteroidota bacterium]
MQTKPSRMIKNAFLVLLATAMAVGFWACDQTEYPPEPEITWNSYYIEYAESDQESDSLYLIINYIDGDGDLGLDEGDSIYMGLDEPPLRQAIFIEYWQENEGEFTREYDNPAGGDTVLNFNYSFPRLNKSDKEKAIRGEIRVAISPWGTPYDTVLTTKYRIKLFDRAGNMSNEVVSSIIPYETPKL